MDKNKKHPADSSSQRYQSARGRRKWDVSKMLIYLHNSFEECVHQNDKYVVVSYIANISLGVGYSVGVEKYLKIKTKF